MTTRSGLAISCVLTAAVPSQVTPEMTSRLKWGSVVLDRPHGWRLTRHRARWVLESVHSERVLVTWYRPVVFHPGKRLSLAELSAFKPKWHVPGSVMAGAPGRQVYLFARNQSSGGLSGRAEWYLIRLNEKYVTRVVIAYMNSLDELDRGELAKAYSMLNSVRCVEGGTTVVAAHRLDDLWVASWCRLRAIAIEKLEQVSTAKRPSLLGGKFHGQRCVMVGFREDEWSSRPDLDRGV